MMPTVSVHIVTYNSLSDIEACLESVFKQTYPVQDIIVVDNSSQDGTRSVLERYADKIKCINLESNVGFAAAHNKAMVLSQADYFLVLNPDVTLHPDYLRELMVFIKQYNDERLGSLTGKLLLNDGILDQNKGRGNTSDESLWCAQHVQKEAIIDSLGLRITKARRAFDLGSGDPSVQWTQSKEVFGVSGAAALYQRKMIEEISLNNEFFDETFFAYKEDVDVAWRARLFGWKAMMVASAWAYHKRGWKAGSRKKQPLFVRRHSYINRYRMMLKNEQSANLRQSYKDILWYELLSFGYAVLREPHLLGAWISLWRDRKRMMAWRRFVQGRMVGSIKCWLE